MRECSILGQTPSKYTSGLTAYNPQVYYEIGNEVNMPGTHYPLTADQYNRVLFRYAAAIRSADTSGKIAAVGPMSDTGVGGWWDSLGTGNFDIASIHSNYALNSALVLDNTSCNTANTFGELNTFGSNLYNRTGKHFAVTEWNSSPATVCNVSAHDSMLNSVMQMGVFMKSNYMNGNLEGAIFWPPSKALEDHRALFSSTSPSYAATETQKMFVNLNPAISGAFQNFMISTTFDAQQVMVYQSQIGHKRKIVVVNAKSSPVTVPITGTFPSGAIAYVDGLDANGAAITCNMPAANLNTVIVGGKSAQVLSIYQ